jgi:uncharacterized caspase-like protein
MRRALLIVLLSCTALPALADKRVALVMATDDYEHVRPLGNAVNDAQAMERKLKQLGFDVTLETDRNLKRMRRALEDFREDAAGSDVALVYFAGHGVEIAGENRLLPTDADASGLDQLKETSLPLEEIREMVGEVGKVGLVMLDACRNDPFQSSGGEGGRGAKALNVATTVEVKPGLGRLGKAENLLYTFSAAPGATAADGNGENSPFTTALVKYLGTDGLEIRSVLTLVQQEVYDQSRGSQLPYVENGLPQLFFASTEKSDLPERERLLLAMADVTPDLRDEVESLAAEKDMPLAPLYGALISSDAKTLSQEERSRKLQDAATAFVATRAQIRTLSSADPAVTQLRQDAEQQLALGAFDTARGKLAEAASIDSTSRAALKTNFVERTTSEATTHIISGGASRADLKYDLAIESYQKAAALFDEVGREELPVEQRQQQLASLQTLGELYLTVGDLAQARSAFERQQSVSDALTAAEPGNADWQDSLAASTLKLGDVARSQGNSAEALAFYERGLELRKARAAASKDDRLALGLEAEASLQIGALHKLQGNDDKALAAYIAARDIAARLAEADPADDNLQRTLARSHRLIGEVQQGQKKLAEARASYQAGLDIARKRAEAVPGDAGRQADLADAYEAFGSIEYDLIDRSKYTETGSEPALAAYDASIGISRKFAAADPRNTSWPHRLAGTLEKMGMARYFGDSRITEEDSEVARKAFTEAIGIREGLVASDPSNKLWVGDMVKAYENMATWYEFQPSEQEALVFSKKAHQAALQLAELDARNVEWQRKATLYHAKIAESYIQMKDYKSALDYEIKGLEYAIGIARANPKMPIYFNDVSDIQRRVARIYWVQKDFPNYWAQNDVVLEQAQRNEQRFPDNLDALRHLYDAYLSVGETWTKNEPQKALDLFANAKKYAEKAASLAPDKPEYLYGVYNAQIKSAYIIELNSDRAAAQAAYEAALATIDKAIALHPSEGYYQASRDHVVARLGIVLRGEAPPKFQ